MENQLIEQKEKKSYLPEIDLDTKKELAKIGMTASMGITVATSMYMKTKFMKRLHVVAGVALVGFSYWHHTLYQPSKKKTKKELSKIDNSVKELKQTKNGQTEEEQVEEENLAISLNDFFVELAVKGKLTHKESQSFKDKIDTLLSNYEVPSINILLDIREFEGIELKGLWDEILFTVKHIKEIKKVSIVGHSKFEEYFINIAHKMISFKLEYFEDYSKAREWLLSN
jgi:hypothetical protein